MKLFLNILKFLLFIVIGGSFILLFMGNQPHLNVRALTGFYTVQYVRAPIGTGV
jgi:hypothetical protein